MIRKFLSAMLLVGLMLQGLMTGMIILVEPDVITRHKNFHAFLMQLNLAQNGLGTFDMTEEQVSEPFKILPHPNDEQAIVLTDWDESEIPHYGQSSLSKWAKQVVVPPPEFSLLMK